MNPPDKQNQFRELGQRSTQSAIGLGYQFMAAMLFFVGIGFYVDSKRGGGYVFTLAGVAFAFFYGGYEVWKLVRLMEQEDRESLARRSETKYESAGKQPDPFPKKSPPP